MKKEKGLTPSEEVCRDRLLKLLVDRCDSKQSEFVKKTGLNQGSVSMYISGKNTPGKNSVSKIAKAFGVAPEWVLGYGPEDGENNMTLTKYEENVIKNLRVASFATQLTIAKLLDLELKQTQ